MAADLTAQIRLLIHAFGGRAGEIMAELIGQAQTDPALADILRAGWLLPRREATAGGAAAGRRPGPDPARTSTSRR